LNAIEVKINKHIEENMEDISTPVRAYLTFQNEEGY
jgi:hypothetical protein